MKNIKVLFFSLILLISCKDNDNPITASGSDITLGGIGTQRDYRETIQMFKPGTEQPYYLVPDSLLPKLSFSKDQLQKGVCIINNYFENVDSISDDFYHSWHLQSPKDTYRQIEDAGLSNNLEEELETARLGNVYTLYHYRSGPNIVTEKSDGIYSVRPLDMQKQFPSVPYVKSIINIGDSWTRYKFIDTSNSKSIVETIATVIGKETVTVIAGTFSAYKIKLTTFHFNPDYSFEEGFEYYTPYVGLVLKESDMELHRWDSMSGITIAFRQKLRKELKGTNIK